MESLVILLSRTLPVLSPSQSLVSDEVRRDDSSRLQTDCAAEESCPAPLNSGVWRMRYGVRPVSGSVMYRDSRRGELSYQGQNYYESSGSFCYSSGKFGAKDKSPPLEKLNGKKKETSEKEKNPA